MRLASVGDRLARPVFVYTRPTYISSMTLLTEVSLSKQQVKYHYCTLTDSLCHLEVNLYYFGRRPHSTDGWEMSL